MEGKTVEYQNKKYKIVDWFHYRLDWYVAELRDRGGDHTFWIKESDIKILDK